MSASAPRLRRDVGAGVLGGVCAGLARRLGIDAWIVRVVFIVLSLGGALGIALYLLLWLVVPGTEDGGEGSRRMRPTGRAAVEVAAGSALLLLSVLLTFRGLGIWISDVVVWPLLMVAAGGALIWRQSIAKGSDPFAKGSDPVTEEPVKETTADGVQAAGALSRIGVGVALVLAAGFVFLWTAGALSAARDVLLSVLVVVVVLAVLFAPWIVRLVRSLADERAQRIRSQERAEMAAHLHDSVLQTLAMVQRRADDPQEVAAIARRQERELRAWLADRPAPGEAARLAPALEAAAADVEALHGVPVEVVVVGDRELDPGVEAVVAAAREAMTNAAKFGGGSTVDVYAESSEGRTQVFVRDRGPGFELDGVPQDRRGVRESIVGRMERHGGRATITSGPGGGTEVELVMEAAR